MSGPSCANPKCGKPRRRRRNRPGYTGGRDLCQPCYQRAWAADFPDEVPEPRARGDRWECAREALSAAAAGRLEEYQGYRDRGLTVLQAAGLLGVAQATAYRYEGMLRERQGRPANREERIAAFSRHRDGGSSVPQAARLVGISDYSGRMYEAELRRRQCREASVAA